MDLTWRDVISTLALVAILVIYAAYLGASLGLFSSAWATASMILLIGLGGRVISVRGDAGRPRQRYQLVLQVVATVIGVVALLAGVSALILDSAYALKLLVMSSIVVWAVSVVSHV